ncbi:hypothetical protein NPIL_557141 [Nephila pilipes]|uniref:Transcription factor CBF/NF-Y/archaeal histone domain-containing protein n=1 Tax=Nephila pilipes TaxID=299642 RepID=A0A8X6PFZ2_NEPPI|nr:hypothetical protein NPIL_557141 [Nephila pilipes]
MKCVPNLLQLIEPHARVDTDAKLMIGDILHQMSKQVVSKTHEQSVKNKNTTVGSQDIISAVNACMGANLAKHAIAEGARNALLFINSNTKYKPEDFIFRLPRPDMKEDAAVGTLLNDITEVKNNESQ